MNLIRHKILLILALPMLASGCDSATQYSGEGKLVDNGPSAATDRYVLDLGPVSLKTAASASYKFRNLPKENFVIGIELRAIEGSKLAQGAIDPVVSLTLLENGNALVAKEARLNDWTWSVHSPGNNAFVYGREKPGTYFTPVPGKQYELTLRVKEPDRSMASYSASLVAKSGGWK